MRTKHLATAVLAASTLFALSGMIAAAEENGTTEGETNPAIGNTTVTPTNTLPKPPLPPRSFNVETHIASGSPMKGPGPKGMGSSTVGIMKDGRGMPGPRDMNASTSGKIMPLPIRLNQLNEKELRARVFASTTSSSTRPIVIAHEMRDKWKSEWMKTGTSTREQIKTKVTGEIQGAINRLKAVVTSLTNIANRIQSRIDKDTAKGLNVTEASNELTLGTAALNLASTDMSAIKTAFEVMASSSNPRSDFSGVQNAVNKVKDDLKAAHEHLEASVRSLKKTERDAHASSTPAHEENEGDDN